MMRHGAAIQDLRCLARAVWSGSAGFGADMDSALDKILSDMPSIDKFRVPQRRQAQICNIEHAVSFWSLPKAYASSFFSSTGVGRPRRSPYEHTGLPAHQS